MKIFLFDIGNVLCDFTYENFLNKYEEISGKRVGMDGDVEEELYHAVERGDISDQTYVDRMNQHYNTTWSVEDLKQAWQQIFTANESGRALYFQAIDKKIPVYTLSNIAQYHISAINRNWDNFFIGNRIIFSYEMGFRKPHPRIYKMVIEQLGRLSQNLAFSLMIYPKILKQLVNWECKHINLFQKIIMS